MRRRNFLSIPAGLLLPWLARCGRSPEWRVGVVPKGVSAVFWQSVRAGVVAAGREFGLQIQWEAPREESDIPRQIEIVESMIQRRVDGLVLAPAGRAALVDVAHQAMGAGIPVTIFDSGIDTERYVSYVSTDNVAAGELAAGKVAELLGGQGQVALVKHMPGSASTEERESAFAAKIGSRYPEIQVVAAKYCMADRRQALQAAQEMLRARPGLSALFGSSEAATVGAMRALRLRQGRRTVRLVGFDASFSLQQGLKDGVIDALVVQDAFHIGYVGVKTIAQRLNGLTPPKRIESPARLITAADLADPRIQDWINPVLEPMS